MLRKVTAQLRVNSHQLILLVTRTNRRILNLNISHVSNHLLFNGHLTNVDIIESTLYVHMLHYKTVTCLQTFMA